MQRIVKKAAQTGAEITIIYVSKSGVVSKRRISVISYRSDHIIAYCYLRRQIRTFKTTNILALERTEIKNGGLYV